MSYTFSYCVKVSTPYLKRRPWWNLWGRDSIETKETWQRMVVNDLSKAEADILISASSGHFSDPYGALLLRVMGKNPNMIQLEHGATSSQCVATSGKDADK